MLQTNTNSYLAAFFVAQPTVVIHNYSISLLEYLNHI